MEETRFHPRRMDSYEVEELVCDHGHTAVYRCRDAPLARDVAIKTVSPDASDPDAISRRLRRAADIRSAIDHCNVLPLYRVITGPLGPGLVAPWLSGGSLLDRTHGRLPLDLLVRVLSGIGSALDALCSAGWAHCDVKFANIFFSADDRPVLGDFASARPIGESVMAEDGTVQMTPEFAPPEACRGEPLHETSDLYSLGVLLYCGLTGRYPVECPSGKPDLDALSEIHRRRSVPPPSRFSPGIGPNLDAVVIRSIAKDPTARYASGAELAAAVRSAIESDGLSIRASEGERRGNGESRAFTGLRAEREDLRDRPHSGTRTSAARKLLDFRDSLDERERMALNVMLARVRRLHTAAHVRMGMLTSLVFGIPSALLALESCGAAVAMANGAKSAAGIADACGHPESRVRRLLELLADTEFVVEERGEYSLASCLEVLYQDAQRLGGVGRPLEHAAEFWNHLKCWVETGEPRLQMDEHDGSRYAPIVDVMGGQFARPAGRLAAELIDGGVLPRGPSILDIGAGSAVWSLAVAKRDPAATLTAVDRPAVVDVVRANAAAAGLGDRVHTLAGDWRDVPLPDDAFDLVLVANLCHLEAASAVSRLIRRVRRVLRPGGLAVLVDTIPDDLEKAPPIVRLQSLRLTLRTRSGELHDLRRFRRWIEEAGLQFETVVALQKDAVGLKALMARRPAPVA